MRKGAFNNAALDRGCNKIAYGHNRDDALETFFLSLFYEGRLHTFAPVTNLDRQGLTLIRPLVYVPERDVRGFALHYGLPVQPSPCPADGATKRAEIKTLIQGYRSRFPHFDSKIFGMIKRSLWGMG
jgi:tRNA(Ile)-lysidine synthase TilS/MesJ